MLSKGLGCILLVALIAPAVPAAAATLMPIPRASGDEALKGISKEEQSKYKEAVFYGLKQRELSLKMRAALAKMLANRPPRDEDVKAYEAALKALDKESSAAYEMISQERWTDADRAKMGDIIARIVSAEVSAAPAAAPAAPPAPPVPPKTP